MENRKLHGLMIYSDGTIVGIKGKMNPKIPRCGYLRITVKIDGKKISQNIHVLVAEAFLGLRPKGQQINHIDGNKLNNSVDNLEYISPKLNIKHSFEMGLQPMGIKRGKGQYSFETIKQVREQAENGMSFKNISDLTGISPTHVSRIINKKQRVSI